MGQEEGRRECPWDNVLRKAYKACGKEIAKKQIAQPLSFQIFLAASPSSLPLSLGFQAEILSVPVFGKLVDHLPRDRIFLLGPIKLNDGI